MTNIKGITGRMSPGNVARIINKYAALIRTDHPNLPEQIYPHMFCRTRACNLYQDGVELELVSRILDHSSTQTTHIHTAPSIKMMQELMKPKDDSVPDKNPLGIGDEAELARLCGIRLYVILIFSSGRSAKYIVCKKMRIIIL